ncbi:GTPase HflX [Clostridium oryzae]|uniref:GTPase HflX n=1 Tax=Clostridium oryzae TaxID=1450648 RepID=A0A1V4IU52_9CLOT|nr:GTPase HflX [Clostridium oryzae]OPJ63568.1 GTPase HflX [Clostridium oryzae]
MIYGNIEGVRDSYLETLEKLYDEKIQKTEIISEDIVKLMLHMTEELNREISVAIDRKGRIVYISIGDSATVEMPIIDIKEKKLSGIRIIHTHPNGISNLSAVDLSALLRLKLDCMAAVALNGDDIMISLGFCNLKDNILHVETKNNLTIKQALDFGFQQKVEDVENAMEDIDVKEDVSERALLIGCDSTESLDELEQLALACNVKVVDKIFQRRNKIDTAFYIGSGKVKEVQLIGQTLNANMLIFDDELSGSQVRNLEDSSGFKVIDRTTLILEIFAKRAKSKESKIQVELAQLKYRIPRLMGLGTVLSRTGGGIGTKGPGEKKLETDRRHINERIYDLRDQLKKIQQVRQVQREKRQKDNIPRVSLVGYTNAGKSTLRNTLYSMCKPKNYQTKEDVFEADMLFATLDTTIRAIELEDKGTITLTDTVGFVRKLPHDLIEAFKSTLEEVIFSDLLVHVVDCSSDEIHKQIEAVEQVLIELGAFDSPKIMVLNKIDKVQPEQLEQIKEQYESYGNYIQVLEISARDKVNLDLLLKAIGDNVPIMLKTCEYIIPYEDSAFAAFLHRNSKVQTEEYRDNGIYIKAEVDEEIQNKGSKYLFHTDM